MCLSKYSLVLLSPLPRTFFFVFVFISTTADVANGGDKSRSKCISMKKWFGYYFFMGPVNVLSFLFLKTFFRELNSRKFFPKIEITLVNPFFIHNLRLQKLENKWEQLFLFFLFYFEKHVGDNFWIHNLFRGVSSSS